MELAKRTLQLDPNELIYHKERFLLEGLCEHVTFVGCFHGELTPSDAIEVVSRGVEPGKIARFLLRHGKQETHLDFDLVSCRFEAENNIHTKQHNMFLLFEITYKPVEGSIA